MYRYAEMLFFVKYVAFLFLRQINISLNFKELSLDFGPLTDAGQAPRMNWLFVGVNLISLY